MIRCLQQDGFYHLIDENQQSQINHPPELGRISRGMRIVEGDLCAIHWQDIGVGKCAKPTYAHTLIV